MNKLVQKNPIQKFKQGKKIQKAEFGNILGNVIKTYGAYSINPILGIMTGSYLFSNKRNKDNTPSYMVRKLSKRYYDSKIPTVTQTKIQKRKKITSSIPKPPITLKSIPIENSEKGVSELNQEEGNNLRVSKDVDINSKELKPKLLYSTNVTNPITPQNYITALEEKYGVIPKISVPVNNYDRSKTRDWITTKLGHNPYEYTGAQRRALRYWLNGDKEGQNYDKNLLGVFGNLSQYAKQGAKLVSKNPIERFKANFIKVAQ